MFLPSAQSKTNPFIGRWDLTVTTPAATYPGWLEIVEKDGKLEGRYQPRGGSVRPVSGVTVEGSRLTLTITAAAGQRPAVVWEATAKDNQIAGVQKRGDSVLGQFTGVPAPDCAGNRAPASGERVERISSSIPRSRSSTGS